MKKTTIALCIGIIIGLMSGSLTGAFAAVSEKVEAEFSKFALVINGDEPREIEPITYKGSTYLPVRDTANMLGYDLTYKADSKTIELNKTVESLIEETEKVMNEEGDPVGENVEGLGLEEQLEQVNRMIKSYTYSIKMAKINLQSAIENNMKEEIIEDAQYSVNLREQKLAEYEAQKAELEAQLQTTE